MSDTQAGGITHESVFDAFVAAQAELTNPGKDKTARIPLKAGGAYEFKYADLASIIDHVRPVLARHGLAFVQNAETADGRIGIRTTIIHTSGSVITFGPLCGPASNDWKDIGSAITYARRYALTAALGIASDDDVDAPDERRQMTPEQLHGFVQRMATAATPTDLARAQAETRDFDLAPAQVEELRAAYEARKGELSVREPRPARRQTAKAEPERVSVDDITPLLDAVDQITGKDELRAFHDANVAVLDKVWDDSGDTLRAVIMARLEILKGAGA